MLNLQRPPGAPTSLDGAGWMFLAILYSLLLLTGLSSDVLTSVMDVSGASGPAVSCADFVSSSSSTGDVPFHVSVFLPEWLGKP